MLLHACNKWLRYVAIRVPHKIHVGFRRKNFGSPVFGAGGRRGRYVGALWGCMMSECTSRIDFFIVMNQSKQEQEYWYTYALRHVCHFDCKGVKNENKNEIYIINITIPDVG